MTWQEAFTARLNELLAGRDPVPLAHAVRAWEESRQALFWALTADADELHARTGGAAQDFTLAAASAVAAACAALAVQHDDTLLLQLGFSAGRVAGIRAWARGTAVERAAVLAQAAATGRRISRADFRQLAPSAGTLDPLLAPGVARGDGRVRG